MISQVNLLSGLVDETSSLRDRLARTQEQVATGLVATTYSGLGNNALRAVSLAPQVALQNTYQANVSAAQGRLGVVQSAMTAINGVASTFYAQINTLNVNDPQTIQSLAQSAKAALQQVAVQLNTKDGDVFVFSGTDTSNPPVTTEDPTALATDLLASSTATPPFSSTIGSAAPKIQIGDGQWATVGLIANQNTYATSQPPTTGSYMRDIMTSLAKLTQLTTDPTPQSTVDSVRTQLSNAMSALGVESGVLGGVQNTLTQQATNLSTLQDTLKGQLSDAEEVDTATAITQAQQLQTQLEASYQVIAQTKDLTLANYL